MDIDTLIRIVAILVAGCILLSTINYSALWLKFTSLFSGWGRPKPEVEVEVSQEVKFLEIVDLWYQLKNSCDKYGLKEASDKLGEVFPLLNVEE
tara:strand:+ start:119 stop:400 length:282 start_codon:yes stop_codon:yes gene_type:complete